MHPHVGKSILGKAGVREKLTKTVVMGYTTQTHLVQPLQSFISIHSLYLLFIFEVNHRDRYRGGETPFKYTPF